MGGCNCLDKKPEENNEINNLENENKEHSEPEIMNPFYPEEYENVMLEEKKDVEEELTDLESLAQENEQYDQFSIRAFGLINSIRKDPASYSSKIIDHIQYIMVENDKKIFKKKVKVLLSRGEDAFREAANELSQLAPMGELVMKPEIMIPLPETEEQLNNNLLLRNNVNLIRKTYNINVYFKNLIKNPEIAVLLLIVDDCANNPGKKRKAILNPEFRKIAINSKFLGSKFISHFSFSK
jgi:hypothetical protein